MPRYVWSKPDGCWVPAEARGPVRRVQIINRDAAFDGGVQSKADGKRYHSRRAWDAHLKAQGMVEIGNDVVGRKPIEPSSALPALRRAAAERG